MVPQTKVFVGSLPQGTRPEDLRRLFEKFGSVTECDIMNRCGFIHMQTEEQAATAIRELNNSSFNGTVISVEKGRIKPRGGGGGRGGMGGGRGGGRGGPPPRGGGGSRFGGPGMRGGGGGGMRGDAPRRPGGGGPMRGPPHGGRGDAAPYSRDSRGPPMRDSRGPPMGGGGMPMRNGGGSGYDRGMGSAPAAYPEDRYNGYDDRRPAGPPAGAGYGGAPYDDRRGGYPPLDDRGPLYPEERRPLYPEDRDFMERRPPPPMGSGYDRPAPLNNDMFSRRSPPMRGGGGFAGERDPYQQSYPPAMRAGGRGGRDMGGGGMGPPQRRY